MVVNPSFSDMQIISHDCWFYIYIYIYYFCHSIHLTIPFHAILPPQKNPLRLFVKNGGSFGDDSPGILCSPGSLMISRFGRTRTAIAASFLAAIGASDVWWASESGGNLGRYDYHLLSIWWIDVNSINIYIYTHTHTYDGNMCTTKHVCYVYLKLGGWSPNLWHLNRVPSSGTWWLTDGFEVN